MNVSVTCPLCGSKFSSRTIALAYRCPRCNQRFELLEEPQQVASRTRTPRRPFSPGWKFVAEVVHHPAHGIVVVTDRPPGFHRFQLEPNADLSVNDLMRRWLSFEVVARSKGILTLRLVDPPPKVQEQIDRRRVVIPAHRIAKQAVVLEFPADGESELEQMVAANDPDVIERIEALAMRRDDP